MTFLATTASGGKRDMTKDVASFKWPTGSCTAAPVANFFAAMLLLAGNSQFCVAVDLSTPEIELSLAGLQDSRLQLRSGSFTAEGAKLSIMPGQPRVTGKVRIECTFDFPANRLRFDRYEPGVAFGDDGGASVSTIGGKFSRDSEKWILWRAFPPTRTVDIVKPSEQVVTWINPFDVRTLGIAFWVDLENGTPFEQLFAYLQAAQWDQATVSPDGVYRLSSLIGKPPMVEQHRRTIWLDSKRGFSPVQLEVNRAVSSDNQKEPVVRSEAEWIQHSGIWVPSRLAIERNVGTDGYSKYELAFNWTQVNEDVDPTIFEVAGFELPKNVAIVDSRLGKPVTVRVTGRNDVPVSSPPAPWRSYLVVFGMAAVVVVALLLIRLTNKRRLR